MDTSIGPRYNCEQVAQIYGVKKLTVLEWIKKGELPAVKTGKAYVIRPEDIRAFEAANVTVKN